MNQKLFVLVIEDSADDAELNINHLKKGGYDISYRRIDTAEEMKKEMNNRKWDLILSDYSMPEFDVPSALDIYHASGNDIPFIVISGAIGEEKAVDIIKAGAHDYLLKDNLTRFVSVVERELRETQVRRNLINAMEAFKSSEEKYRSYVENATDGVFVVDEKGRYIEVNTAATLITGYTEKELLGMTISDLLPPEYIQRGIKQFISLKKTKSASGEWIIIQKNGTRKWCSVDVVILSDTRFLGFIKDINERKKFELEIRSAKQLLEQMNEYLINAREDERVLISMEIHDELGQALTALKLDLNWIRGNIDDKSTSVAKLNRMIGMTNDIIKKVQRISSEIHPAMLEDLGLASTIEWYCGEFQERTKIKCELVLEDLSDQDSRANLALFRILQEALTNVIRHAQASSISVTLHNSDQGITMTIEDDGIGISTKNTESCTSNGIIGMRQRARQFGGTVEFLKKVSKGTTLVVFIPKLNDER